MGVNKHFNRLPWISSDEISLRMTKSKMTNIKFYNLSFDTDFFVAPLKLIGLATRKGLRNKSSFSGLIFMVKFFNKTRDTRIFTIKSETA